MKSYLKTEQFWGIVFAVAFMAFFWSVIGMLFLMDWLQGLFFYE